MSYFHYIAVSREIFPCYYGQQPDKIYSCYREYLCSPDFQYRDRRNTIINPLEIPGSVCIYNSRQDFLNNISFSPFPDLSKQESENFFIAGQFSYPHIYVCDYNLDFICKYLRRDECMEQLTIFLSQSEPLKKPEFETIDLQDYVEGRLSAQEIRLRSYDRPGNKLLRFIPPKVPQSHLSIAPICLPEDQICNICRDQDYEIWNLIKLHHMGLL